MQIILRDGAKKGEDLFKEGPIHVLRVGGVLTIEYQDQEAGDYILIEQMETEEEARGHMKAQEPFLEEGEVQNLHYYNEIPIVVAMELKTSDQATSKAFDLLEEYI